MTTTKKREALPSLDAVNARVWKLAAFVHPPSGDHLGWIQRVLSRYSVEARTIDGALTYEWAVVLWNSLLDTEHEKSSKLLRLYEQEREANGAERTHTV
jgi:hypothetical protein